MFDPIKALCNMCKRYIVARKWAVVNCIPIAFAHTVSISTFLFSKGGEFKIAWFNMSWGLGKLPCLKTPREYQRSNQRREQSMDLDALICTLWDWLYE